MNRLSAIISLMKSSTNYARGWKTQGTGGRKDDAASLPVTDLTIPFTRHHAGREDTLEERIDMLRPGTAAFVLKALLVAGHVSKHVMKKSLDLADTLKEE